MNLCLKATQLYNWHSMLRIIAPSQVYPLFCLFQGFQNPSNNETGCQKCRLILRLDLYLCYMQKCIIFQGVSSQLSEQLKPIQPNKIIQKFNLLLKLLQEQKLSQQLEMGQKIVFQQTAFNLLQLYCGLKQENEAQYQGIYKYYKFSVEKDEFFNYFFHYYTDNLMILYTMGTLQKHYPNDYLYFLIKITEIIQYKYFTSYYIDIHKVFQSHIFGHDQATLIDTFRRLHQFKNKQSKRYPNITIIYHALFVRIESPEWKEKIAVTILKLINFISTIPGRQIRFNLLCYWIRKIRGQEQMRQKLTSLTKRLMLIRINIFGLTALQNLKKIGKNKSMKQSLVSKLSKINQKPYQELPCKLKVK